MKRFLKSSFRAIYRQSLFQAYSFPVQAPEDGHPQRFFLQQADHSCDANLRSSPVTAQNRSLVAKSVQDRNLEAILPLESITLKVVVRERFRDFVEVV